MQFFNDFCHILLFKDLAQGSRLCTMSSEKCEFDGLGAESKGTKSLRGLLLNLIKLKEYVWPGGE